MKSPIKFVVLAFLLAGINREFSTLRAQGSLMPPGSPAPTMKSLAQIEPRIPIGTNTTPGDANAQFIITQPGSYYLATNLQGVAAKEGIYINSPNVVLDLMGFELAGNSNSYSGIYLQYPNATIRNGTIRNWPAGIFGDVPNCRFEQINFLDNQSYGVLSGQNCMVLNCIASGNGNDGFHFEHGNGSAVGCTALNNGWNGFAGGMMAFTDCSAQGNGFNGFNGGQSSFNHCTSSGNTLDGINATHSTISHCTAYNNTRYGINASDTIFAEGGTIDHCMTYYNRAGGIRTDGGGTVQGCLAANNWTNGIVVGNGCTVIDSSAFANGSNGIAAGNGCSIISCTARTNVVNGILAGFGCTIRNCTATDNRNDGIEVVSGSFISQNDLYNNGIGTNNGAGIHVTGNNNRVDENHVSFADRGIEVSGIDNLITRNSVSFTSTNYVIANFNKVGAIVSTPYSGPISGNSGGAGLGTTDPWANLSTP